MPQQGTKMVKVEGKTFRVPVDATPDEIDGILSGSSAPIQAAATPTTPTPGYFKETLAGLGRAARGLASIPKQLMTPHETLGATREQEVKMGPVGRLLYNIPADVGESMVSAEGARERSKAQGEGAAGQRLSYLENSMAGPIVRKAEEAGPGRVKLSPQTVGAVAEGVGIYGGSKVAGRAFAKVGDLRNTMKERVRTATQHIAGAGPERTTEPMVEEFKTKSAEATAKQADEVRKTDEANRQKVEQHQTAKRNAFQKGEEQTAEHTLQKEEVEQANQQERQRVNEINEAATQQQGRRSELARNIKTGGQQLGEKIKEVDVEVRAEGNAKYADIRGKLAKDPGVPMADVARDARTAEGMIKGSTENIKQFRELIRKAPESEGIETSAGFVQPGDPLYDQLQREGAIDTGGNLPFDQLQGYSSEIGMKLSKGGLPGDVYQALKYLKEKIDTHKASIAERNGLGPQLKAADSFWFNYMDTFHDKPSAVAAVRERVGKLDPEFYAEPFISGKAGQTGIGKLQRYDAEIAALATSLRTMHAEFSSLPKTAKVVTPKLAAGPSPPSPVEPPKRPELAAPKQIEQPTRPSVEDVRARKTKELKSAASNIGRFDRWDARILATSAIGPLLGHWEAMLIDPAYLVARKGVGRVLDRPAVQRWLSEPGAEDLRILNSLPPEVKATVQANITDFAAKQGARNLSPAVRQFLGPANVARIVGSTGAVAGSQIKNRKDALQLLGR